MGGVPIGIARGDLNELCLFAALCFYNAIPVCVHLLFSLRQFAILVAAIC